MCHYVIHSFPTPDQKSCQLTAMSKFCEIGLNLSTPHGIGGDLIPFFVPFGYQVQGYPGYQVLQGLALEPKPIARRPLGTPQRLSWSKTAEIGM